MSGFEKVGNRSSAVIQQRKEPHNSLDDFPTPPWATRALCEWLQNPWDSIMGWSDNEVAPSPGHLSCREPAANRGHMARPLREYFREVIASDIHDYSAGFEVMDYLFEPSTMTYDWTITNPPFRLAERFIEHAIFKSRVGVAMLVRTAFLEGVGRYGSLFRDMPPSDILQFSERVVMHKGRLVPKGSTATAYCWVVWQKDVPMAARTKFHWIAPCRKRLECDGDYA